MQQTAKDFLTRCFASSETIALLLRSECYGKIQQRVVTVEQVTDARYLNWLAYQNHHGANLYAAANPLRSGSRKRTKESIVSVRHIYIDIDEDGDARLAVLRASDDVPAPSAILSTSPGKYQALWRVEGFDFATQEDMLKRLASAFGGDPACTDCNRVLRIPGFYKWKYTPAHCVSVEYPSDATYRPADFRLPESSEFSALPLCGNTRLQPSPKDSHSEQDWAWVCAQLVAGADAKKLTRILAERRADKPNPLYYAQRTIDIASARQWLLEGASLEDVITMLKVRRDAELPAAQCCARAREIATTSERMIHRKSLLDLVTKRRTKCHY